MGTSHIHHSYIARMTCAYPLSVAIGAGIAGDCTICSNISLSVYRGLPELCIRCLPRVVAKTNSASSRWDVSFAVTSAGRLGETISFRRPAVSAFMREACVVFS